MPSDQLSIVPPLLDTGRAEELEKSGRTLHAASSPLNETYAVYPASSLENLSVKHHVFSPDDQLVYFVSSEPLPLSERRLFIGDTSIIFAAWRNLLKSVTQNGSDLLQDEPSQRVMRKLALDYVNFAKECWVHTAQSSSGARQVPSNHYRTLYTCLSLFVILYVPEYGLENAPVGDDLMEWLNTHFIEPSTEEGDHLSTLEHPWVDETFWPYLTRATLRGLSKAATFFLGTLSAHPSKNLRKLSQILIPLLDTQPKLQAYEAEREFAYASHRWREKIKALRLELDDVPESDRRDDYEDWWDRFSDIIGILEGRGEMIQKVCEDLGADWKEVCVAWGVFVDSRLRRQDLPDVIAQILEDMPPDPTNLEDMVHASLFTGDPVKALDHAAKLDPWLGAHLADMMEPLALVDKDPNDSGLTPRNFYILSYAQYLHADSSLWRITVAYMFSCGRIGAKTADEVLVRVPLRLNGVGCTNAMESNADENSSKGDLSGIIKDLNATCHEYERENARRSICKVGSHTWLCFQAITYPLVQIAARTFVQKKEYGLALSYSSSAEDWPGLGRVVDRILLEYIHTGPEQYTRYVLDIAPSLQALRTNAGEHGVFIHRLIFAVRYAEFHQRLLNQDLQDAAWDLVTIFQEEIAPKSWWGLLLCDAVQLLQHGKFLLKPDPLFSYTSACILLYRLDEVCARTAQGSGEDYLRMLEMKLLVDGRQDTQQRLQVVRLALAKYFARCAMIGTGGTQTVDKRVGPAI
ncbi:Nup85 nucleoporin-domain-containing protein [Lanmaoa asiatica]|nr:Nup85 nucleoporin-domain-containing protein [Lanmaoa asiatica]